MRIPREPDPGSEPDVDIDIDDAEMETGPGMSDDLPDMTRERARTERRDVDKERGEPLGRWVRARRPTGAPVERAATR